MPTHLRARLSALIAACGLAFAGLVSPAAAGTPSSPEITDRAGDANYVSDLGGQAPGTVPGTGEAQADWADITSVWVSTDFHLAPATVDGVRGRKKVPYGFAVHVALAGTPEGVGNNIAYEVQWAWNNCTYSVVVQLPGAAPDSRRTQLYEDCAAAQNYYDLGSPQIQGNVVTAHVPFAVDLAFFSLFPGASLAEIRAWSGHYVDGGWPSAYRPVTRRYSVIDYAPSEGDLGYFELASDLEPTFIPAEDELPAGHVVTLAGGSQGDGLPAERAPLAIPRGVVVGPDGYVYIADFFHHRIRRVGPDGRIEAFAGMVIGNGGDGGDALLAHLDRPMGMDFDAEGNLYVADGGNHRIRKITPERIISTVAGNGVRGFGGDGGKATKARLSFPGDVAVDSKGNVYIADTENRRVRRVDAATGLISTYAGGGSVTFTEGAQATSVPIDGPQSIAIGPNDDLYIGGSCRVYRVDASTQAITRPVNGGCGANGDGGPAAVAQLGGTVAGLDVTDDGRLWISDTAGHRVRVVTDGIIETVAGTGATEANVEQGMPALEVNLDLVWGTSVDADGNLYVMDQGSIGSEGHDRVLQVRPDGTTRVFAGNGRSEPTIEDGDPAASASFVEIESVEYDAQGRLYVAEAPATAGGGRIWRIDPDGRIHLAAGNGLADPDDGPDVDGPATESPISHPLAMEFGPDGTLYIADVGARQVKAYDPDTGRLTVAAGEKSEVLYGEQEEVMAPDEADLYFPKGLAVAPNGDVYWSEAGYGALDITRIRRLHDGAVEMVAGTLGYASPGAGFGGDGGPARDASYGDVHGLDFDEAGNLLVADTTNARVRRVDVSTGRISTIAGDGAHTNRVGTIDVLSSWTWADDVVAAPGGGTFVIDSGDRYVDDDFTGPYVDYVSPSGMTSHVAGTGTIDLTGDGPALATPLLQVRSAALGPQGLAIADYHRVRLVTPPEGGWPDPAREVVCLPNQTDKAADARTRIALGFFGGNNPSFDLRETTLATEGADLVATVRVEDLDPVWMHVHYDPQHQTAAWGMMIWSPSIPAINMGGQNPSSRYRWLGAFAPVNVDTPTATAPVSFEYGSFSSAAGIGEQGTPESYSLKRLGPATGSMDFEKDTITIRVPLSALGLEPGERITYQDGLSGGVLQYATTSGTEKPIFVADAMPSGQKFRSVEIGRSCPDGYV
ncbi:MAG TPA: hypothetical protein VGB51_09845 [Actinomycetota bacterium]